MFAGSPWSCDHIRILFSRLLWEDTIIEHIIIIIDDMNHLAEDSVVYPKRTCPRQDQGLNFLPEGGDRSQQGVSDKLES